MFFRNLKIYRLTGLLLGLEEQLQRAAFQPCPSHQPVSRGWVSPTAEHGLVFRQGNDELIALRTEQRLLPNDVVALEVAKREEALAFQQGYAPGRKQLRELKARVVEELMPKAFVRQRTVRVWINQAAGWLVIDTASGAVADNVIGWLRHTLDDLPLISLRTRLSPSAAMADWLAGEGPEGFTLDDGLQVKSAGEAKMTVTYQHHPIEGRAEIRDQIAKGLLPTKLAMTWDNRLSFALTEDLDIKRLAFLDIRAEDGEEQSDLAIMAGELRRFLPDLVTALGGEVFEE